MRRAVGLIVGAVAVCDLVTCKYILGASPRPDELVAMVIDAVHSNYANVHSAQLTASQVLEDARVDKRVVLVRKEQDGGKTRILRTPRQEWDVRITLRGADIRMDKEARGPVAMGGSESRAFVDGIWTHYVPENCAAWIQRTEDLPGMLPIDPRQVGTFDVRRPMSEILREERIVSAKLIGARDGDALVRIMIQPNPGSRISFDFRSSDDFLPTRLMTYWPDGSILQLMDFKYQDVLDGEAKFLKRLTQQFFARGRTRKPTQTGWRQRFTLEVDELVLNQKVSDETLVIQVPPGTRVSDNTKRAVYHAGPVIPHASQSRKWWHTAALVSVIVVLISLRSYRRSGEYSV